MLHLHPLKSRVMDMELKLKVAMDNLIRRVKVAADSRPPPGKKYEQLILNSYCLWTNSILTLYM